MKGLFLAATHKSSGKTTLAIGLAAALAGRGKSVRPFKKGPDYIDPMWLALASGRPCYNLDFNTMDDAAIGRMFADRSAGGDVALVEGNKGLFDGVDLEGRDSNAALAALLGLPVVLVVDTVGMTRGIAPLLLGYQAFGPELDIAGVILNKVGGPRHEGKLRRAVEHYTDVPVLGALGRHPEMEIDERHLGLVPANEAPAARALVEAAAAAVAADVDLEKVLAAATDFTAAAPAAATAAAKADIRIAIARDAAFGFYYPDDLEALAASGAELVPFDALRDGRLPDADGLFIGGGFPETHAADLAANAALRTDIHDKLAAGLPAYAECGGLMYLCRSLSWRGERHEMVGAVPADAVMHDRPVGRGYARLRETRACPWPSAGGGEIPAHEFHYASLEGLPDGIDCAYEVTRGYGIDGARDGLTVGNLLAAFVHQRNVAPNRWAERFVAFVRAGGR